MRRIHQFEKVEQFVVTSPHEGASWAALDEMVANAEAFYQVRPSPNPNALKHLGRTRRDCCQRGGLLSGLFISIMAPLLEGVQTKVLSSYQVRI